MRRLPLAHGGTRDMDNNVVKYTVIIVVALALGVAVGLIT